MNEENIKVIGVGGFAKAGKDTFVGIAKNILKKNGYNPYRIAFADPLKNEVQNMLQDNNFSLDVFHLTPEDKERIRPLLVFWGCQRRHESEDGLYWVVKANNTILSHTNKSSGWNVDDKMVFLVSDLRFPNEEKWVHERWNGKVIHIRRYTKEVISIGMSYDLESGVNDITMGHNNKYDNAPNEEEAKQDPLVLAKADARLEWENKGKRTSEEAIQDPELQHMVLDKLNELKYFNEILLQ